MKHINLLAPETKADLILLLDEAIQIADDLNDQIDRLGAALEEKKALAVA
jgi:hypothetical protein